MQRALQLNLSPGDRVLTVPPDTGDLVLPHTPLFEKLLRYANRSAPRVAIRDLNANVERTYPQLLTDALAVRKALYNALAPAVQQQLAEKKEIFIALLAPGGYEYAVGFMAILALGAAVVPLCKCLLPAPGRKT